MSDDDKKLTTDPQSSPPINDATLAIGQAPLLLRYLVEEADDALGLAQGMGIDLPEHEDLTREATRTRCAILRKLMDLAGQFYLREIVDSAATQKSRDVGIDGFRVVDSRPPLQAVFDQGMRDALRGLADAVADALDDDSEGEPS